jgi:hypothetical protein
MRDDSELGKIVFTVPNPAEPEVPNPKNKSQLNSKSQFPTWGRRNQSGKSRVLIFARFKKV